MILQRKEVVSMDTITTIMVTWPHQSDFQSLTLIETVKCQKNQPQDYRHQLWETDKICLKEAMQVGKTLGFLSNV